MIKIEGIFSQHGLRLIQLEGIIDLHENQISHMSMQINRHELNLNHHGKIYNCVNKLGSKINKTNELMGKGFNIL